MIAPPVNIPVMIFGQGRYYMGFTYPSDHHSPPPNQFFYGKYIHRIPKESIEKGTGGSRLRPLHLLIVLMFSKNCACLTSECPWSSCSARYAPR